MIFSSVTLCDICVAMETTVVSWSSGNSMVINTLILEQKYLKQRKHGVQSRMVLVVNFFLFLKLLFFYSVVAILDLVHYVEAIHSLY